MTDDEVARFQAAVQEVLADCADPEASADRLRAEVPPSELLDWLLAADPRMLRVAWEVARRWGAREG